MKTILRSSVLLVALTGLVPISYAMESITPMPPLSIPGQIPSSCDQESASPQDAVKYIGRQKTVCGKVTGVHFADIVKDQPTYIYIDKPFPNQVFTILISGSDRGKFQRPPATLYSGKEICVTGIIQSNQGRPEIIVKDPSQIKIR